MLVLYKLYTYNYFGSALAFWESLDAKANKISNTVLLLSASDQINIDAAKFSNYTIECKKLLMFLLIYFAIHLVNCGKYQNIYFIG